MLNLLSIISSNTDSKVIFLQMKSPMQPPLDFNLDLEKMHSLVIQCCRDGENFLLARFP